MSSNIHVVTGSLFFDKKWFAFSKIDINNIVTKVFVKRLTIRTSYWILGVNCYEKRYRNIRNFTLYTLKFYLNSKQVTQKHSLSTYWKLYTRPLIRSINKHRSVRFYHQKNSTTIRINWWLIDYRPVKVPIHINLNVMIVQVSYSSSPMITWSTWRMQWIALIGTISLISFAIKWWIRVMMVSLLRSVLTFVVQFSWCDKWSNSLISHDKHDSTVNVVYARSVLFKTIWKFFSVLHFYLLKVEGVGYKCIEFDNVVTGNVYLFNDRVCLWIKCLIELYYIRLW